MKLTFYGGAGAVTGANYLLETGGTRILVDCGLVQGGRFNERQNFEPFPYDVRVIDAVLVTHAHIDHIGRIPLLWKAGYRGPIYSTPPTKDIAEFLLLDSEHVLSMEAREAGERPLYTANDVIEVMKLWKKKSYHEAFEAGKGVRVELYDAGHVLGSSSIMVEFEGRRVAFSGDLGNVPEPLIRPTEPVLGATHALIESAYGGRVHEDTATRKDRFEDVIEDTARRGGTLLIPAFALERTQEILFELNGLVEQGRIPRMPVFLDSPLAIKLTTVYQKYAQNSVYFNEESARLGRGGDEIFDFPGLHMSFTTEQSKDINRVPGPKIVIAGAGMSNGGRIVFHEKLCLPDPKSTILFIGYQAEGSLGRKILDGERFVTVLHEEVEVRARVEQIPAYSAHADQPQLLKWVEAMSDTVQKVFVVQGEGDQPELLAAKLRDTLAVEAVVPKRGESYEI